MFCTFNLLAHTFLLLLQQYCIAVPSDVKLYANLSLLFSTITYLHRCAVRQRTDKSIIQRRNL